MADHAAFSPSGASLWLNCPAAVPFGRKFYRPPSGAAAARGAELHEVAAKALKKKTLPKNRKVLGYVRHVLSRHEELGGNLLVEEKVSVPGVEKHCWGTLDAAIVVGKKYAEVFDLKTGATPVAAEGNLQMLTYAVALGQKNKTQVTIYQGEPVSWRVPPERLKSHLAAVKVSVREASMKKIVAIPGKWCRHCRAGMFCPAYLQRKPVEVTP
jgi:hypothetical protein